MLKVLKSGFYTTVQDQGRLGYLNKGVPVSGFMDSFSASKLNLLLDNDPNAAVIEVTMTGPTLEFEADTYICFGGAEFSITLNNKPLQNFKVYKIQKGDILSYGRLLKGFRNYLAIKKGFNSPKVLGSRSWYFPLTSQSHFKDQAYVNYEACSSYNPKISEWHIDSFIDETILEVTRGPEFEFFNPKDLERLFTQEFSIAKDYNRMAYQIEQKINGHKISMLTSATLPGTVQLTPSGKLIILMKDGQTTGGYPRLLQLSDKAISILAQKKYGDFVSFKLS